MDCKTEYISPLGKIFIVGEGEYLTGLWFNSSRDAYIHDRSYEGKSLPIFEETEEWLNIYFSGRNPGFIPKFKMHGITPFRQTVVDIMLDIPYGEVVTYGDIAKKISKACENRKISAQAVGGAVGWNPICLIVPCHRVVGAGGNLTGYGGGIKNKTELLRMEGNDMSKFFVPKRGTAL